MPGADRRAAGNLRLGSSGKTHARSRCRAKQGKLAQQLRIVARLIGVRDDENIPQRRQVFFVSLGGFDTHDHQLGKQAELLGSVANSIAYFQQSMENLGIARNVMLFTASDFGRALLSNGDGSDHDWGGLMPFFGQSVLNRCDQQLPESNSCLGI